MSTVQPRCPYPDCGYPAYARGLCERHYNQDRTGQELRPIKRRQRQDDQCSFEGCDEKTKGLGLCAGHYSQHRNGKPLTPLRKRREPGVGCETPGCDNLAYRGGYCSACYQRIATFGTAAPEEITCINCGKGLGRFRGLSEKPLCGGCKHLWRQFHPEENKVLRRRERAKLYGLTVEQMDALLARGRCDLCGCTEPRGRGDWHIDHDHSCCPRLPACGKCVRGLLCFPCNQHIGYWKDDPSRLRAVIRYLRRVVKDQQSDGNQGRLM